MVYDYIFAVMAKLSELHEGFLQTIANIFREMLNLIVAVYRQS